MDTISGQNATTPSSSAQHPLLRRWHRVLGSIEVCEADLDYPVRGEMAMWRAVITQALTDAATDSRKAEAQFHKNEALHWLTGRSEDFSTVCHYAGFEPGYIRRMVKNALARQCKWRLPARKIGVKRGAALGKILRGRAKKALSKSSSLVRSRDYSPKITLVAA